MLQPTCQANRRRLILDDYTSLWKPILYNYKPTIRLRKEPPGNLPFQPADWHQMTIRIECCSIVNREYNAPRYAYKIIPTNGCSR